MPENLLQVDEWLHPHTPKITHQGREVPHQAVKKETRRLITTMAARGRYLKLVHVEELLATPVPPETTNQY